MNVTVTIAGVTQEYPSAREAAVALFAHMGKTDLSPLFWSDTAREELRKLPVVEIREWPKNPAQYGWHE